MSGLKEIELSQDGTKDLAVIDSQDGVWLVVPLRWWDLATLLYWLFCPSDRQARAKLTLTSGEKVSFRVVRVATRHVRIRGVVR